MQYNDVDVRQRKLESVALRRVHFAKTNRKEPFHNIFRSDERGRRETKKFEKMIFVNEYENDEDEEHPTLTEPTEHAENVISGSSVLTRDPPN